MPDARLVLASRSTSRARLLRLAGFEFEIDPSLVVEEKVVPDDLQWFVRSTARSKALEVRARRGASSDEIVLGADTIAAMGGRAIFKPEDDADARNTLERLSGRQHEVLTGYCLLLGEEEKGGHVATRVHFRTLIKSEIDRYVAGGYWRGRSGGYGIVEEAVSFVSRVEGSISNVIGLPLPEIIDAWRRLIANA